MLREGFIAFVHDLPGIGMSDSLPVTVALLVPQLMAMHPHAEFAPEIRAKPDPAESFFRRRAVCDCFEIEVRRRFECREHQVAGLCGRAAFRAR